MEVMSKKACLVMFLLVATGCDPADAGSAPGADATIRDDSSIAVDEFAKPCTDSSACESKVCVPDPKAQTDGFCAAPCTASGTSLCTSSQRGCLLGWFRWQLTDRSPIYCRCMPMSAPDAAGGGDTDCDGLTDEDAT